jgi:hypothetical protein
MLAHIKDGELCATLISQAEAEWVFEQDAIARVEAQCFVHPAAVGLF